MVDFELLEIVVGESSRLPVSSWRDVHSLIVGSLSSVPWGVEKAWCVFDQGGDVVAAGAHGAVTFITAFPDPSYMEELYHVSC